MALEDDVPEEVRDIVSRFAAFADGYIALVPGERTTLGDMRYSLRPEGFEPLGGIELERADGITQARWVHPSHDRAGAVARLWRDVRTAHDYEDAP